METKTIKFYSLDYRDAKTYLVTSAFVLGNILLPQLFHLIPNGGVTLLPIYFFTLIGAYKYGWKAGLMIAVLSPLINSLFFGMPSPQVLPAILIKSGLLAVSASLAAKYFKRISVAILLLVVLSYQIIGTMGEWILTGNFALAIQDFHMAIPGMLLQIFGGYFLIRYLIKE